MSAFLDGSRAAVGFISSDAAGGAIPNSASWPNAPLARSTEASAETHEEGAVDRQPADLAQPAGHCAEAVEFAGGAS